MQTSEYLSLAPSGGLVPQDGKTGDVPALSLKNVWKVFGASRSQFAHAGSELDGAAMKRQGWVPAVRDVSLDVAVGEIFVIMGLSGSGKSTLLRCLPRLVEPTAGSLLFHGRDILSIPAPELVDIRRNRMGMVFQNFALLPNRTVLGNIAFPLEIQKWAPEARRKRAMQMLEMVGLSGYENRVPAELSGGQQQRVGIARSLAVDPELWLLDEPFSALDPLIRGDLQNELLRLQKVLAKTIVFITHDLQEAVTIADRIAIMKDGVVVQIATPEALVTRPADPYVARFTASIAPAKVVRAGSLVLPGESVPADAIELPRDATVETFGMKLVESTLPFVVMNGKVPLGLLDRQRATRILAGDRDFSSGDPQSPISALSLKGQK